MRIGNFDLDKEVLMVAEIGNNHEGSLTLAEELIGLAAQAGAGAVKFQTFLPERLVAAKDTEKLAQLRRFQLSYEQFRSLKKVADRENILFLSTPFDIESARFLADLVPAFKIASGDNDFFPMIEVIAQTKKPIILSAGLTSLEQIAETKEYISKTWSNEGYSGELALLHCVVNYPTSIQDANLLFIKELQKLGTTVGYSDHTIGIEAAVYSVVLGARIVEKHFTKDKNYSDFRDHQISADPQDLAQLVLRIKEMMLMLGDGKKRLLDSEVPILRAVRRSIAANRYLKKGTILSFSDFTWLRPGIGYSPGLEQALIGRMLVRDVQAGETILPDDVRDEVIIAPCAE